MAASSSGRKFDWHLAAEVAVGVLAAGIILGIISGRRS